MKGLEFLGQLAKQFALSSAGPWWFQGAREMEQNATLDGSENQSVLKDFTVAFAITQRSLMYRGLQHHFVASL